MVESGYYQDHNDNYIYVISEGVLCKDNNTQDRFVIFKYLNLDTIFIKPYNEFDGFIDNKDGERLKKYKRVNENIPYWPPTINPSIWQFQMPDLTKLPLVY